MGFSFSLTSFFSFFFFFSFPFSFPSRFLRIFCAVFWEARAHVPRTEVGCSVTKFMDSCPGSFGKAGANPSVSTQ